MSENENSPRKKADWHTMGVGVTLLVIAVVAVMVLLFAPVLQLGCASKYLDEEQLRLYATTSKEGFYQFILSAFAVLAVIAGYLTYRSAKEAKEEARQRALEEFENLKEQYAKEIKGYVADLQHNLDEAQKPIAEKISTCEGMLSRCQELHGKLQATWDDAQRTGTVKKAEIEETSRSVKAVLEEVRDFGAMTKAKIEEAGRTAMEGVRLPVLGESKEERRARELFNEGVQAYECGRSDDALDKWLSAIQLGPKTAAAAEYNVALLCLQRKDYEQAITHYRRAISLQPGFPEAYANLGNALLNSGNTEEAIKAIRQALKMKPSLSLASNNLAIALMRQGNYKEAIEACGQALESGTPQPASAYYNRACAHALAGSVEEAANDLARAIGSDAKYRDMGRKDRDFDGVRQLPAMVKLLGAPPYDGPQDPGALVPAGQK